MNIIPERLKKAVTQNKLLNKSIIDIEDKVETLTRTQNPIFFQQYTDHGIDHFSNTLKMAMHLIDIEEIDKLNGRKSILECLSELNIAILISAVLFHDLGMHIHFNGFKQLLNGYFDDVKVDFFDELTWREEWDNFMIEAKRFSGRDRISLFGDEQIIIKDVDLNKQYVDSDIQKTLIGEFLRRHHGRLAHEIAIKGFPTEGQEVIEFALDLSPAFKDIIGVIARSHTLDVRDAMMYIEEQYPADGHFPYDIEVPFLMCVLRIADYFQFDATRTNSLLVKLRSFSSPYSLTEHKAHLATEYFKTDEKDPETLFVSVKPADGVMYTKLTKLFASIQRELDTSFAVLGEMHGRTKEHLKLRYRRIKTNLKNRKVISKLPYIADVFHFEADTDLFKLLVGPLYGYDTSYGVRELIQNAVDACVELAHKKLSDFAPTVKVSIKQIDGYYAFIISDNGKGMSIGEIKNYFLKAGASFRNSMEWKIDNLNEENIPAIRRTGKFGIGVLASFLIGDEIEVTTKRYNEEIGYSFSANLSNEFIEIKKNLACHTGTTITIRISETTFQSFKKEPGKLTKWYVLSYPQVTYCINENKVEDYNQNMIALQADTQYLDGSVRLKIDNFDDIVWKYVTVGSKEQHQIAINGIIIPRPYSFPSEYSYQRSKGNNIHDQLDYFPFVSILDRNNIIDLELSRNSIRGPLPFINELVESCKLDFLYQLLFFNPPVKGTTTDFERYLKHGEESVIQLGTKQFYRDGIFTTPEGYIFDDTFFNRVVDRIPFYKIFDNYNNNTNKVKTTPKMFCTLTKFDGVQNERAILRGDYGNYIAISKPDIYKRNYNSNSITKGVRERIEVVKESKKYIVFKNGDFNIKEYKTLMELFDLNNADAVQLIDKSLSQHPIINKLLKTHFPADQLIPYSLEEKKSFARKCSEEFQDYVVGRGIKLSST